MVIDDDPGRDLGLLRQPGHRFFFEPRGGRADGDQAELTFWSPASATSSSATMASASRWRSASCARVFPPEVRVVDFGIRGFDLAYALLDGYDVTILVDASPRGERARHAL